MAEDLHKVLVNFLQGSLFILCHLFVQSFICINMDSYLTNLFKEAASGFAFPICVLYSIGFHSNHVISLIVVSLR